MRRTPKDSRERCEKLRRLRAKQFLVLAGEGGGVQAFLEVAGLADEQFFAIEPGTPAALSAEAFVVRGIVHHTQLQDAAALPGDGYDVERYAVRVIDRSVQRVDEPAVSVISVDRAGFLRQDGMRRESALDGVDEVPLAAVIDLGNQVGSALESNIMGFSETGARDFAGFFCPLDELSELGLIV